MEETTLEDAPDPPDAVEASTAVDLGVDLPTIDVVAADVVDAADVDAADIAAADAEVHDARPVDGGPRDSMALDASDAADVLDAPTRADVAPADGTINPRCGDNGQTCCAGSMACRSGLACQAFLGTSQCQPCGGQFQYCCDGGCTRGACRLNFCTSF
jgi:hypothetical protein